MLTRAIAKALFVVIIAAQPACPGPNIPAPYCPESPSDKAALSTRNEPATILPGRDAASLRRQAKHALANFQKTLPMLISDPKQEPLVSRAMLDYAMALREASWAAYGEVYDAANEAANNPAVHGNAEPMTQLSELGTEHKVTLLTLATILNAKTGTRPGSFQVSEPHVRSANCVDACRAEDWKNCSSCVKDLGAQMDDRWNQFCKDWNGCDTDLACAVQRMEALASLIAAITQAIGAG